MGATADTLPTLSAPGAQPDTTPPPDVMQALQGQQAGAQAQPSMTGPPPASGAGSAPIGSPTDLHNQQINQILDKLTELQKPSPAMVKLQKSQAYTPEQRRDDKYNAMFGISKVPTVQGPMDPNNPNPVPTKQQIDWKKFVPATLSEMARAFVQKDQYVPAKERLGQQALQEYTAETGPLAREAQYDSQNQRAAARDAVELLKGIQRTDIGQQRVNNQSRLIDLQGQNLTERGKYYRAEAQKLDAQLPFITDQETARTANLQLDGFLKEAQKERITAQTEGQKLTNEGLKLTGGLRGTEGLVQEIANKKQAGDIEGAAQLENTYKSLQMGKASYSQVFGRDGSLVGAWNNKLGAVVPLGSGGGGGQGPGSGFFGPGGATNQSPDPNTIQETPRDPFHVEGSGMTLPGPQLSDSPMDRNYKNDILLAKGTGKPLTGTAEKAVQGAVQLVKTIPEFGQVLSSVPDNELPSVISALMKSKTVNGMPLAQGLTGISPQTQIKFNQLLTMANTIGISHLAVQGTRPGQQGIEHLQDLITGQVGLGGTNAKQSMFKAVQILGDLAEKKIAGSTQYRDMISPQLDNYWEAERLLYPKFYNEDLMNRPEAQKYELDRRQKIAGYMK